MEEFLSSSRELPAANLSMSGEELQVANDNITLTILQRITTHDPDYTPKYPRAVFVVICLKFIGALFVLALTIAIRKRDFLKVFVLFLLVPILLESGIDVFRKICEIASLIGQPETNYFLIPLFFLRDFIFWSSLFSSVVAFYYSIKAITKPVKISYTSFYWCFLKIQHLPLLLTVFDTVSAFNEVPSWIENTGMSLRAFITCLVALVLLAQGIMSLIVFCVRRDEFTKTSPHDQIRHSKWRLFWFIIFQIVVQAMNAPYMLVSGLVVMSEFFDLFDFAFSPSESFLLAAEDRIEPAMDAHLIFFFARPFIILLATIFFLVPYRRKFRKLCCPCCVRD